MEAVFLRAPYNYDTDLASDEAGLLCEDETLTQQHEAADADINTIVRRFGVTGVLPQGVHAPVFADFAEIFDFQSAQHAIIEAERAFMAMPAEVRQRFGHDPQQFVEFCSDAANAPEMRRLGLLKPEPAAPAPVIPAATSSSPVAPAAAAVVPPVV